MFRFLCFLLAISSTYHAIKDLEFHQGQLAGTIAIDAPPPVPPIIEAARAAQDGWRWAEQRNTEKSPSYRSPCLTFQYKLPAGPTLCSRQAEDTERISAIIKLTQKLYKEQIDARAVLPDRLIIVILTPEELNNPQLFPNARTHVAVGRYLEAGRLRPACYITREGLTRGSTDLAHEIIHALNDSVGTKGIRDEELAYEFEARNRTFYE